MRPETSDRGETIFQPAVPEDALERRSSRSASIDSHSNSALMTRRRELTSSTFSTYPVPYSADSTLNHDLPMLQFTPSRGVAKPSAENSLTALRTGLPSTE